MAGPVVCCRKCGAALLAMDQVQKASPGERGLHLVAEIPWADRRTTLEPHSEPGVSVNAICRKLAKVHCARCKNSVGSVQQMLGESGTVGEKLWYIKVKWDGADGLEGCGFRRDAAADRAHVHASTRDVTFKSVCGQGGAGDLEGVWMFPRQRCPDAARREPEDGGEDAENLVGQGGPDASSAGPRGLDYCTTVLRRPLAKACRPRPSMDAHGQRALRQRSRADCADWRVRPPAAC